MKFSKRQDVEAPLPVVFAAVSDFAGLERAAMRRGIEVARQDRLEQKAAGMSWRIVAPIRGRPREIVLRLVAYNPETDMRLTAESGGIDAVVTIALMELSRTRSRLQFGVELTASTLTARVLLQSAKLAKGSLDRKFAKRIEDFAADIAARQKKPGRVG
jgi:hypothetical protein